MRSNILFTLCFISALVGQPSFTANTITTRATCAMSVYAVDIDVYVVMVVQSDSIDYDVIRETGSS